jgi:heme/copper-type cytochrome/quinol oxidase subunit 3
MGFFLFIVSEAVFFLGIFWAFIHLAIVPSYVIGVCWPPRGLETIDKFLVPVCNTLVLLCSGISITWSHRAFLENKREDSLKGLEITVILGIVFLLLQFLEYKGQDSFVISSTSYYSAFYFATGFHGFHVFIGTVFLIISLQRFLNNEYTQEKHIWYEVSIWYWHFVDIIWLFVYLVIYYWGGEPRSFVWY